MEVLVKFALAGPCASCGIEISMPESRIQKLKDTGNSFYCPNGHTLSFKKTDVELLRAEIKSLREMVSTITNSKHDSIVSLTRTIRSLKGQITKLKRQRDKHA